MFAKLRNHKNLGILAALQRLGKALLYPIAILPFAAIMLRVGAQIGTSTEFSSTVQFFIINMGGFVFDNLFMFFAIGVAFGLAKDNRGEAAIVAFLLMTMITVFLRQNNGLIELIYGNAQLGGAVLQDGSTATVAQINGPLITTIRDGGFDNIDGIAQRYNDIMARNVLNGIIVGILVAAIYNKFNGIELPSILGFFSGRRMLPVLTIIFGVFFIIIWAIIFPWIALLIVLISQGLAAATGNRFANAGISGVFGLINRLLIPFGLHHIPNTLFWFQLGSHPSAADAAVPVVGDIFIFLNGAAAGNNSGTFQSGFFPIMMFGLPAIAYAMIRRAETKEQRTRVAAILIGPALISFFTGITEPIEFAFLYASPLLFGMHAVFTGIFSFIVGLFGIQLGFGFSAGLVDYALSIPKSLEIIAANKTGAAAIFANPGWIWVIGAVAALTYYFSSSFLIKKLNLATPGRGTNLVAKFEDENAQSKSSSGEGKYSALSRRIITELGGVSNISEIEFCSTRLRLTVEDKNLLNLDGVRSAGTAGAIIGGTTKSGKSVVHVIIGTHVEIVAKDFTYEVEKLKKANLELKKVSENL